MMSKKQGDDIIPCCLLPILRSRIDGAWKLLVKSSKIMCARIEKK